MAVETVWDSGDPVGTINADSTRLVGFFTRCLHFDPGFRHNKTSISGVGRPRITGMADGNYQQTDSHFPGLKL